MDGDAIVADWISKSPPNATLEVRLYDEWTAVVRGQQPFPPVAVRYMERKFVDEFFNTGRIRISTFSSMANLELRRRDENEGLLHIYGQNSNFGVGFASRFGHDAYVLCTSGVEDDPAQYCANDPDSFRIHSPHEFGMAIARHIPGFKHGLDGYCLYRDPRMLKPSIEHLGWDSVLKEGKADLDVLMALQANLAGPDGYFLKPAKDAEDSEYRILWLVDKDVTGPVFVTCPEALAFCSR